jgi:hypothetical protein
MHLRPVRKIVASIQRAFPSRRRGQQDSPPSGKISAEKAKFNSNAFGLLQAQTPDLWRQKHGVKCKDLQIVTQDDSKSILRGWEDQLSEYRDNEYRTLSDLARSIIIAKMSDDILELDRLIDDLPQDSPLRHEFTIESTENDGKGCSGQTGEGCKWRDECCDAQGSWVRAAEYRTGFRVSDAGCW